MQKELILEKFSSNQQAKENDYLSLLKSIANDSLFYFAVFLSSLVCLQIFPFISGIIESYNIGINEVAVSTIGFTNVFIWKVYNKILRK